MGIPAFLWWDKQHPAGSGMGQAGLEHPEELGQRRVPPGFWKTSLPSSSNQWDDLSPWEWHCIPAFGNIPGSCIFALLQREGTQANTSPCGK